jgi:Acyl-CoA thioester hydrolase/BAAT N-terminal region/Transposase, Mutator family
MPVHVTVSGLPPGERVTVQAQTRDGQGRPWESQAHFRASAAGTLNLATAVPVSGSYHVADANGLPQTRSWPSTWAMRGTHPGNETGNVRNGSRPKTVLTNGTGQVGVEVPRDRDGTFAGVASA